MDKDLGTLWKSLKNFPEGLRIILRSAPEATALDIDDVRRHGLIPYPRLLKPVDWTEFGHAFEDLGDWLKRHGVKT